MGEVPGSIPGTAPRFDVKLGISIKSPIDRHVNRIIYTSARLAQLVERKALNLVVVGSSPTVGVIFSDAHFSLELGNAI